MPPSKAAEANPRVAISSPLIWRCPPHQFCAEAMPGDERIARDANTMSRFKVVGPFRRHLPRGASQPPKMHGQGLYKWRVNPLLTERCEEPRALTLGGHRPGPLCEQAVCTEGTIFSCCDETARMLRVTEHHGDILRLQVGKPR